MEINRLAILWRIFLGYGSVLFLFWYSAVYVTNSNLPDLEIYRHAAQELLRGEDIYQGYTTVFQSATELKLKYLYPPFLAVVLSWFESLFPSSIVKSIWNLGCYISLVASGMIINDLITQKIRTRDNEHQAGAVFQERLSKSSTQLTKRFSYIAERFRGLLRSIPTAAYPITFIALWPPTLDGLYWGQVNPFILILICFCLRCEQEGRAGMAGFYLGLAAGLKGTPLVLAIPWVSKLRVRSISGLIAGVLITIGVSLLSPQGSQIIFDFLRSLRSLALEDIINDPFYDYALKKIYGAKWGPIISIIVVITYFLISTFKVNRGSRGSLEPLSLMVAGIPVMILIAPCVWFHHLLWMVIPISVSYADLALTKKQHIARDRWFLLYLLYCLSLALSLYLHILLRINDHNTLLAKNLIPPLISIASVLVILGESIYLPPKKSN